jgi:hypothetical protein
LTGHQGGKVARAPPTAVVEEDGGRVRELHQRWCTVVEENGRWTRELHQRWCAVVEEDGGRVRELHQRWWWVRRGWCGRRLQRQDGDKDHGCSGTPGRG